MTIHLLCIDNPELPLLAGDFRKLWVYHYGVQRWIVIVVLLCLCLPLSAQTEPSAAATGLQTYTSPDGRFQLSYPDWFTRCSYQNDSWGSCASYMPMCGPVWSPASDTPICVAYPPDKVPRQTYFLGAAFSVSEINGITSKADCEGFAPNASNVGPKQRLKEINGQTFTWISMNGAAMGHAADARAYRGFHDDRCFEIDVVVNFLTGTGYEPGELKEFDTASVKKLLSDTLGSFRFAK
jgi:hypothetical protein